MRSRFSRELKRPQNKKELIEVLEQKLGDYRNGWRVEYRYLHYLIEYLKRIEINDSVPCGLEAHIPHIIVDAMREMREAASEFQRDGIPDLVNLGESPLSEQVELSGGFAKLLDDVFGDEKVSREFYAYCNAQHYVLWQTFDRFLSCVYRRGMHKIIEDSNARVVSGVFGRTKLNKSELAGRLGLTFYLHSRPSLPAPSGRSDLTYFSFRGEMGDKTASHFGLIEVFANLRTCVDMINDVIAHWPKEESAQRKIFVEQR